MVRRRYLAAVGTLCALVVLDAGAMPLGRSAPDATSTLIFNVPSLESRTAGAAQTNIDEGLAALRKGDLSAAEKAFSDALSLDPGAPGAYLGLAEVAGRRGKDADVEAWLRKGLKVSPRNVGLLASLGHWSAMKGRWAEAERAFAAAAEVAPQSPKVLTALGEMYLRRSNTVAKAEATFRKALAADAHFMPARLGLARALAGLGRTKEAESALEDAMNMAPKDPRPLTVRAHLAASQGHLDEAIKNLDEAIRIAPGFLPAYLDKGDLQMAKNDPAGAAATYRAGATHAADPVPALFRLGVALQADQRWDEAERAYLEAVKRDPKVFGAYNNLAFMMAERRTNLDKALVWIRKAAEIAPSSVAVRDTEGWVYRARGDLPRAAAILEEARKLDPKDSSVHYHLGVVYAEQGRKANAIAAFKQALALNPGSRYGPSAREYLERLEGKK